METIIDYPKLLATRTKKMSANVIREILKVVSKPGMISLAGGIPAPESFPLDVIKDISSKVISKYGPAALQYDLTEGFIPLREQLVTLLGDRKIFTNVSSINVGSGSQGILDGIAKLLIDKNDKIALEAPTYLGAISAFNQYEPNYIRMDMDDEGLIPDSLDYTLKNNHVKFVYLVPTFQNPTGRTLSLERRIRIAEIIKLHNVLLVEDDPYSALRYRGDAVLPIESLAPDNVIYISTLSKVLAPGLRIGFFVAPEPIRQWLVLCKQSVDLHTSTFNQALAAQYLEDQHLEHHLPNIISLYRSRQEVMLTAIQSELPSDFRCTPSDGGMFLWVVGPKNYNMLALYKKSVEKGVAFVPGKFFFTEESEGIETMRLNYSMPDEGMITRAVALIGEAISETENAYLNV